MIPPPPSIISFKHTKYRPTTIWFIDHTRSVNSGAGGLRAISGCLAIKSYHQSFPEHPSLDGVFKHKSLHINLTLCSSWHLEMPNPLSGASTTCRTTSSSTSCGMTVGHPVRDSSVISPRKMIIQGAWYSELLCSHVCRHATHTTCMAGFRHLCTLVVTVDSCTFTEHFD